MISGTGLRAEGGLGKRANGDRLLLLWRLAGTSSYIPQSNHVMTGANYKCLWDYPAKNKAATRQELMIMGSNRLLLMLVLCVLVTPRCFGDDGALAYKIGYEAENGSYFASGICVWAVQDGSKGFDGEDAWPFMPSSGILLGIRRVESIDGWNHDTGWYTGDTRETLSVGQSIAIDGIYMWAVPGTPSHDMHLHLLEPFLYPGVSFGLSLVSVPAGVEYEGPRTWGPEVSEIALPFYSTDDGESGYKFRLDVSAAVPEPTGLLALGVGGVGILGTALRRRKSG